MIDIVTAGGNFLPDIQSPMVVDGASQPDNEGVCTADIPDRPPCRVVLDGDGQDIGMRLEPGSDGSVIRGLNFRNLTNAIQITRSNQNRIECNFIGTARDGVSPLGNGFAGVSFFGEPDADDNFVGVLPNRTTVRGNVIGANGTSGILVDGDPGGVDGTDGTVVVGNDPGTDRSGTSGRYRRPDPGHGHRCQREHLRVFAVGARSVPRQGVPRRL